MRFLLFITLFTITQKLSAQAPEGYDKVLNEFTELLNDEKFSELYEMFAIDMKQALSLPDAKTFFSNIHSGYGQLNKLEYQSFESPFQQFKGSFDNGELAINVSINEEQRINGLYIVPFKAKDDTPIIDRTTTDMSLPFKGTWFVFWGGDTKDQNYHVESRAQKNAFDFIIVDKSNTSHIGDGRENKEYYAFGQEILSPCDGEIIMAVDGILDNIPGKMNPSFAPGNCVILKTVNEEYILLAHFKNGSVLVKQGQSVKQGEVLALCGNSGNSSEAHLHFHAQNTPDLNKGVGIKTYFNNVFLGNETKSDYSPVKGNLITQGK